MNIQPKPADSLSKGDLWLPIAMPIREIRAELIDVDTYVLQAPDSYTFLPGQFNMIYIPGYGEAAISISSNPATPQQLEHTVRAVGDVTRAMHRYQAGDSMLLRGPFGYSWPVADCEGCDIILACGGLGLAPLRPVIYHIMNHRDRYGEVYLMYGARTPEDLLYPDQYPHWRQADIQVEVTVDRASEEWQGAIGVVTSLMQRISWRPEQTRVMTCGPEIMMRYVAYEALARKVDRQHIFLSMERNMKCAVGFCGHCQLGPSFVCKDGPVFTYQHLEPFLSVEDL